MKLMINVLLSAITFVACSPATQDLSATETAFQLAIFAEVTNLASASTDIPTQTPEPTATREPTNTPKPTLTPTPTLAPGEFAFSAQDARMNYLENLGLECMEVAESSQGGYFWDCTGKEGNNVMRAIYYSTEENKIHYMYAWVLNVYNPSRQQVAQMFSYVVENTFPNEDNIEINRWITAALIELEGQTDMALQQTVKGFELTLSGAGICAVLEAGEKPPQGIDAYLIPPLGDIEIFCRDIG